MLGDAGRVAVMGILNVTPDSFSDGGRYADPDSAVRRGLELWRQGADLVDLGGESTRPGADPVDPAEELRRRRAGGGAASRGRCRRLDRHRESIGGQVALDAGALAVNDVTGLSDPDMAATVAESGSSLVVMHMPGDPRTMHLAANYTDVVGEVRRHLLTAGKRRHCGRCRRREDLYRPGHRLWEDWRPQPRALGASR